MRNEPDRMALLLALGIATALLLLAGRWARAMWPVVLAMFFCYEVSYRALVYPPAFRVSRTDIFIRL